MGMGFLSSVHSAADAPDPLPAAEAGDAIARFTAAAAEVGLIRPGDKLDRNMVELCLRVVEMAALIGDRYPIPGFIEDSVGSQIRDQLQE
jgi:hypothetical protein